MLKRITGGLKFDEDMTCAGGYIPIVGIFTRGFSGRKFGNPLEHFPDFYCANQMNGFPYIGRRLYSNPEIP